MSSYFAVTFNPFKKKKKRAHRGMDRKQTSRHSKYNSQNKSPVYCQTTNFAHTSKQAVIKEKVADRTKRKRKEALLVGLTLPYKQTSYGTAKVHTLNLLECSEFNSVLLGFYHFSGSLLRYRHMVESDL